MKRNRVRIFIGVLGIAIVAGLVRFWFARHGAGAKGRLVLHGNVDIRQVQLAFNDRERITALLVREGDRVHAGQLVATLETHRFEAAVASDEAKVAAQRQAVLKAEADTQAAQADLNNAEVTFKRVRDLRAQKVVSSQDLDNARATLDGATARLAAAKQDIAAAKATLKANEAELEMVKPDLVNAKLYAPSNGVIQDRLLEPGDMASPQAPVFTLALDDPLWVRAYVSETDLGKIRQGMKAEVSTDSMVQSGLGESLVHRARHCRIADARGHHAGHRAVGGPRAGAGHVRPVASDAVSARGNPHRQGAAGIHYRFCRGDSDHPDCDALVSSAVARQRGHVVRGDILLPPLNRGNGFDDLESAADP
jgi:HlyD family secretion protein